jgi:hypothetical protein
MDIIATTSIAAINKHRPARNDLPTELTKGDMVLMASSVSYENACFGNPGSEIPQCMVFA